MYQIVRLKKFDKSLSRLIKSGLKESVLDELSYVIDELKNSKILPVGYRDHKLSGDMEGSRSCHLKGDLVLVYTIYKSLLILELTNIGSHNQVY